MNTITYSILTVFLAFSSTLFSQTLNRINFSSDFEEETFEQIEETGSAVDLDVLLAMEYSKSNEREINTKIDHLITDLKNENIQSKKLKKRVALIHKTIHDRFLKLYKLDASFGDIFSNGNYNCAGATALYAIAFEKLGIKYQIKELPTHVYLIADPDNEYIKVETTIPGELQNASEKGMAEAVEYLNENKVISASERNRYSTQELYEKYYSKENNISLYQLGGLLYFNKGVDLFNDSKYKLAANELQKAYEIYPSNGITFLLNASLKNALITQHSSGKYSATCLIQYLNLNTENDIAQTFGYEVFQSISQEKVIDNPQVDNYKRFYKAFSNNLHEDIDLDRYNQVYYRVLGYNEYVNQNYQRSLDYLNFAYVSNPNSLDIQELVKVVVNNYLVNDRGLESSIDSLEQYFEIFPFLSKNKNMQSYHTYCMLVTANDYFAENNPKKGTHFLQMFEKCMQNNLNYTYSARTLESAYINISYYYTDRDMYSKATNVIAKALHYEPNSVRLQNQLKEIKEESSYTYIENSDVIVPIALSREEQLKKDIGEYLNNCWETQSMVTTDNVKMTIKQPVELKFKDNKKIEYQIKGKSEHGKWSARYKARILYLIPERDKSQYSMLKIESITSSNMIVRSFTGKKMDSYRINLVRCKE